MHIPIIAHTLTSAAGVGLNHTDDALWNSRSGLVENNFPRSTLRTFVGRVSAADEFQWPAGHAQWHSRNNALAAVALQQDGFRDAVNAASRRYGAGRVGVIIGTSTSSIGRTEDGYRQLLDNLTMPDAYRQPNVHNPHSPAAFVAHWCDLDGPAMTVSTACSSSAKVFASATRWLATGVVDAVLVGGVDSLCLSVLHGFDSLELISPTPCRPFDRHRDGINLGEAAGFALLALDGEAPLACLSGYGESSDAWHMSHPHPHGLGARLAISSALKRAGITAADIGYVNLHGTASRANDSVEANVLGEIFPATTRASSTKGWTGHTLGAAGIAEAVIALQALRANRAPGTLNLQEPDPDMSFAVLREHVDGAMDHVMSNSFGFGGSNCSVVFSRSGA